MLKVSFQSGARRILGTLFLHASGPCYEVFVSDNCKAILHLLHFVLPASSSAHRVILLIVVPLTLDFEFLGFDVLLDLVKVG